MSFEGEKVIISIIGMAFLVFRVWIVEFKLTEQLQFRRRYFSRFFSYYTCLALSMDLGFWPFNVMVMVAFPILIVTSIWDINFMRRFKSQEHWAKTWRWGLLERITLHPPVVLVAVYMILMGGRNFIEPPNLIIMGLVIIVLFLPFFLLDVRWTKRYKWPEAVLIIGLLTSSGASLLLAEAFLWGVSVW
ncbi:MAG: hypothetical protein JSW61_04055 [Candidatus Thorarchaeota archaeon]|nr:MAG: hypothetical protein JSW61_04055 [Candidatus Thorarchaeota archaeon]